MIDLEFFRHIDGALVVATVTYETFFDSDFYEVGEQIVWRNYHWNEWKTAYMINGQKYNPTAKEFKEWEREVETVINNEAA